MQLASLFPKIEFERLHQTLRREGLGRDTELANDVRGRSSLTLATADAAFTYVPSPEGVAIEPGDFGEGLLVLLSDDSFAAFHNEIYTIPGLFYAQKLQLRRGSFEAVRDWEPALRFLYSRRPIFAEQRTPAVAQTTFTMNDLGAAQQCLQQAGFVHVAGVLTAEEVEGLRREADALSARARPEDGRSWWATLAPGQRVLCRVTYTSELSEPIARLPEHDNISQLVALAGNGLVPAPDRLDGSALIFKHPDAVEGLADLPWHIDCGLGGHSVMCPVLQVSVFLDEATKESGHLRFLAGAHFCSAHLASLTDESDKPVFAPDVAAGDCVLHFSDTPHIAPPPTGPGPYRRSIVISFYKPSVLDVIGPGQAFNDLLLPSNNAG